MKRPHVNEVFVLLASSSGYTIFKVGSQKRTRADKTGLADFHHFKQAKK